MVTEGDPLTGTALGAIGAPSPADTLPLPAGLGLTVTILSQRQ
jgi:hypothetical protein